MPVKPIDPNNYAGIVATPVVPQSDPLEQAQRDYLNSTASNRPSSTAGQDIYTGLEANANLGGLQEGVNTANSAVMQEQANLSAISAQLQGISNSVTAQNLGLDQKGMTQGAVDKMSTANIREAAIQALPLQSQALLSQAKIQSLQGNAAAAATLLSQAQERVDKLFSIQMQDIQNTQEYNQKLLDTVLNFATDKQKQQLEEKRIQNDQEFQLQRDAIQNQYDTDKILLQASLKPSPATNNVINPSAVTNPVTGQPVDQGVLDNLNLTNQLLGNPKLKNITGVVNQFLGGFFGQAATAKNQFNQLKGQLSLEKRSMLKGSGAISDYESKVLAQAASSLDRNLSDKEFRDQLLQVKGVFQTAAGGQTMVTITDPVTKQSKTGMANSIDINNAIASGYTIKYSE
jgi:hypothetical protein